MITEHKTDTGSQYIVIVAIYEKIINSNSDSNSDYYIITSMAQILVIVASYAEIRDSNTDAKSDPESGLFIIS